VANVWTGSVTVGLNIYHIRQH